MQHMSSIACARCIGVAAGHAAASSVPQLHLLPALIFQLPVDDSAAKILRIFCTNIAMALSFEAAFWESQRLCYLFSHPSSGGRRMLWGVVLLGLLPNVLAFQSTALAPFLRVNQGAATAFAPVRFRQRGAVTRARTTSCGRATMLRAASANDVLIIGAGTLVVRVSCVRSRVQRNHWARCDRSFCCS